MLYFKNIIWIIWDGRSCYSQLGKYNLPHYVCLYTHLLGFPGSSTSKQSTFNTGDPGSIPGVGRSPGEGIGYPLQGSWASLMAQMVNNLPAMQETWVRSLGWEYPLEEGMATHSSILAWMIPMDRGAWQATVHGVTKSQIKLSNQAQHSTALYVYIHTYVCVFLCAHSLTMCSERAQEQQRHSTPTAVSKPGAQILIWAHATLHQKEPGFL